MDLQRHEFLEILAGELALKSDGLHVCATLESVLVTGFGTETVFFSTDKKLVMRLGTETYNYGVVKNDRLFLPVANAKTFAADLAGIVFNFFIQRQVPFEIECWKAKIPLPGKRKHGE